ncbi:SDR family NAD(P)-dependent oxidoreductase, partial [Chloroflexota bacterium]
GSGQGIGRAIAINMAKEGAKVVTNNRRPGSTSATYGEAFLNSLGQERRDWLIKRSAELTGDAATTAQTIRDMGGEAVPFFGDVSDFDTAGKLIQTAVDNFGGIHILVNVAGTFGRGFVWEMTEETWDHVNRVKPKSHFNCIRHACPLMIEQRWGRIINCTSRAWLGVFDSCNYSAANAGVVGLTRAVAMELYQYGITCNAFAPHAETRAGANLLIRAKVMEEAGTPIMSKEFLETRAANPLPGPEELAPFISYLATDEAANISGTTFNLRGSAIHLYSEPEIRKTIGKKEGLWTVAELIEQVPKTLLEGYKNPAAAAQPNK